MSYHPSFVPLHHINANPVQSMDSAQKDVRDIRTRMFTSACGRVVLAGNVVAEPVSQSCLAGLPPLLPHSKIKLLGKKPNKIKP